MTIWITRTRPGADRTAERLAAEGFDTLIDPLLEVRPVAGALDLSGFAGLAFTGPNAVEIFAGLSPERDMPAFAVGDATAEALTQVGFRQVHNARGDVAALARLMIEEAKGRILYPAPAEPAAHLPDLVAPFGINLDARCIYETVPVPPLRALATPNLEAVMIHSPRAAHLLAEAAADRLADLVGLALSDACAAPLRTRSMKSLVVAPFPDDASLVRLAVDTLSKAR